MITVDFVGQRSLGTGSTAAVQLSGDRSGNAADYVVPTGINCVLAVRPKLAIVTPTVNEDVLATMYLVSKDIPSVGDFEVFASPIGGGLGTNETMIADPAPWYWANIPCKGGQRIQFWGNAQTSNTAAAYMGVDVLLSSEGAKGAQRHYLSASVANGATGPTSTSTAAGVTNASTLQLNSGAYIFAVYGVEVSTTPAASKPHTGFFALDSTGFTNAGSITPIVWGQDPIQGFLGTTTFADNVHISKMEGLNVPYKTSATVKPSYTLGVAITTAGKFAHTIGYS